MADPRTWAAAGPTGIRRYVPILRWLPRYETRLLRFDVIAGATVWGLLVPEAMAYAGLAGMPPQAGLYTLLATLVAYAIFGTSRHLIAGPTSAAAVLLASSVGALGHAGADVYAADAAVLVLLCGALLLLAGLLRLGFVTQFLSRPVMNGFIFGLAIFVTVSQLPKLFGIETGGGDTISQLVHVIAHLGDTSAATLAVGVAALALLFGIERAAPRAPGGLVALTGGIVVSAALGLSGHGVEVVGHVPSGLPSPGVPSVDSADVVPLLAAAGGMMLVIFSESLGAATAFGLEHGYPIDANQELIALGAANAGSGLLGGLAGGGSLSQSAVNEGAGARSELSAILAAALIVVTVLLLTPLFKDLPEAVLAALIIHAVSHLWKIAALRRVYVERRVEFALGLATLLGVVTLNVLPGLVIGVLAMLLLLVYNASRPHVTVLGRLPDHPAVFVALDRRPEAEPVPGILVLRLEAPLVYANAAPVRDRVKRLVGEANPTPRAVILEMGANDDLDITAAEVLTELVRSLHAAGVDFAVADIRDPVIARARLTGLLTEIGEDRVFNTLKAAVKRLGRVEAPA